MVLAHKMHRKILYRVCIMQVHPLNGFHFLDGEKTRFNTERVVIGTSSIYQQIRFSLSR
jgi:hypothetical protein